MSFKKINYNVWVVIAGHFILTIIKSNSLNRPLSLMESIIVAILASLVAWVFLLVVVARKCYIFHPEKFPLPTC